MSRHYSHEELEKLLDDLHAVIEECKQFHQTYTPCPENVAVQVYEMNEIVKMLSAEMEKIKKLISN